MTAATVQPATAAREGEAAPMAWLASAVGDRRQQEDEKTGTGGESCDWADVSWAILSYVSGGSRAQPKSCAGAHEKLRLLFREKGGLFQFFYFLLILKI
jgi:hypothetical protein